MTAILILTKHCLTKHCLCRANFNDPSNMLIEVDFRLPSVFVEGEYKAQGKIVGFPLGGKGVYNISMSKASIARSAGSVVVAVLQELHVCTARVTVNINTAGAAKEDHDRQTDRHGRAIALSPQNPGFEPRPIDVGFMVDKLVL